MLSYQHSYHAGNAADLHKHAAFAVLIRLLTSKARPITVIESHAGRGLYDLAGAEALKTHEAANGIARATLGAGPYREAIDATRAAHGASTYPGSPLIARALLRPQDRLILCELHPQEHAALATTLGSGAEIHRRDGHEGLLALSPPTPRRGLALIDPSYEVKDEYALTAQTARRLMARWPEAVVMVWAPILPAGRHRALLGALSDADAPLFLDEVTFRSQPDRGMTGSVVAILSPPFGAAEALAEAWADFSDIFTAAG